MSCRTAVALWAPGSGASRSATSGFLHVPSKLRHPSLQPLLEHRSCEADVAADAQAREGAGADGFVDPAGLDGEQLGGLGWRGERAVEAVAGVVVVGHRASSGWFMRATAGSA